MGEADGRRWRGSRGVVGEELEGSWTRGRGATRNGGRGQFTVRGREADSPGGKKKTTKLLSPLRTF
jgi:hypothetical protein